MIIVLSLIIIPLLFKKKNNNKDLQNINQSKDLANLSIQKLIEKRNKYIDQNVELLKNFGASEQELIDRKEEVLKSEWGLVSFVDKNYNNLTEKEKLIKQIKLIEYLNLSKDIMYPAGDYFKHANEEYQLSEYLVKNKKEPNYMSYENLKFLINNLNDLSNFIDYDIKSAIDLIYAPINNIDSSLKVSKEQKINLNNELKKISSDDNVSPKIKNKIKELYNYTNN